MGARFHPKTTGRSVSFSKGFTLIEMLLVVAIIGIMSALIISAISNASQDSRAVLARQQQALVQQSLNAWISRMSSGTNSIANARTMYNAATTAQAKFVLIQNYLDQNTYEHFIANTTDAAKLQSEAMVQTGVYLQFSSWATNSYPRVNMVQ